MNISWYINRLRSMSIPEVLWRLEQRKLQKAERQTFGKQYRKVTEEVFYQGKEDLTFHMEKLPIADMGADDCVSDRMESCGISLLGDYDYETYKKDWHAGFQTGNPWPLTFSYDLQYKQCDDIGDARTNWELNRHFQFALLACRYDQTGDGKYLSELRELFEDWNEKNPFLHGISWTSVMEAAIRVINWTYALGFVTHAAQRQMEKQRVLTEKIIGRREEAEDQEARQRELTEREAGQQEEKIMKLCGQLRNGIVNMASYVSAHYSRYSSANNHVIVEAAAMGIAGIVMECEEWYETAFIILQEEMGRQNYRDGVNKEVSLHYQSFFMEAVGLLILVMRWNNLLVPQSWRNTLCRMSRYMQDCQGRYGETVVFGDDDEGKILDLSGGKQYRNHYLYVLQLMSLILPERYVQQVTDPTLLSITQEEAGWELHGKPYYHSQGNVCYEEGGVSLLKSADGSAVIGIDHGALGFGSIAAHGHADALSFQMYLRGVPVFADAGTYLYHIDLENRNAFRRTENHNTITIDGKDQSEMLGAFLWGKRAQTRLVGHNLDIGNGWDDRKECGAAGETGAAEGVLYVEAEHDGYAPVIHRRRFVFDGRSRLTLYDSLLHVAKETAYQVNFLLGADCSVAEKEPGCYRILTPQGDSVFLHMEDAETLSGMCIEDAWVSGRYGYRERTKKIRAHGQTKEEITIVITIDWERDG